MFEVVEGLRGLLSLMILSHAAYETDLFLTEGKSICEICKLKMSDVSFFGVDVM